MGIFENTVLIEKKQTIGNRIGGWLCIALTIVCLYMTIFVAPGFFLIPTVVFGVIWYFLYIGAQMEYEYTYIQGRISIARIKAKRKRKEIAKIEMEEVLMIAPSESHELDSYRNNQVNRIACVSGEPNVKSYQIVYKTNNALNMLEFEPDMNMLEMIQGQNPRKVVI